jgi:hypothetical protein
MLHCRLSQIDVDLNGKTITSSTSTYAYRAMVETLLDYEKPAKEFQLTAAFHAKALEYANGKYPMQRVECKTFTVPANHLSINKKNIFMYQLPTRVV